MQWPPWSSSDSSAESSPKKAVSRPHPPPTDWQNNLNSINWAHYTSPSVVIPTFLLTTSIIGLWGFYRSYLRRIPGSAYIRPGQLKSNKSLFGTVTRVGDGDNFHLFHTPGGRIAGWGWARQVPEWTAKGVKGGRQTIPIRIAGIDAPENAHFGKEAQPFATEALAWLKSYLLDRRIRAIPYRRDQYDRIVATVYVRKWGIKRDVGLEMLKVGMATVYEAKSGAEFGLSEQIYRDAEAAAKRAKRGIWSRQGLESPREYKTRTKLLEEGVKKAEEGSLLSKFIPWIKK